MPKTTKKQRLRRIFELVDEDMQYFKVLSISPVEVKFSFQGDTLTFRREAGQLFLSNSSWLRSEDYALLYRLAEQLMTACLAGFKKSNQQKLLKSPDPQLKLFKPAQLPRRTRRSK